MQLPPYPPLIYRNGARKEKYSEALHLIYNERIVPKDLNLLGKTVSLTWDSSTHGKNDLFWHLITGKYDANVEDLRFDRGERLLYIPYMIEHCDTSIKDIHWFYQTEKSRSKLIILNFDLNNRYLCAFRENVDCFQLLTGFPPSLRSFKKKIVAYKKYWENKNRPLK